MFMFIPSQATQQIYFYGGVGGSSLLVFLNIFLNVAINQLKMGMTFFWTHYIMSLYDTDALNKSIENFQFNSY